MRQVRIDDRDGLRPLIKHAVKYTNNVLVNEVPRSSLKHAVFQACWIFTIQFAMHGIWFRSSSSNYDIMTACRHCGQT